MASDTEASSSKRPDSPSRRPSFGLQKGAERHSPHRSPSPAAKRSKFGLGDRSRSRPFDADAARRDFKRKGPMRDDADTPGQSEAVEENPTLALFTFRGSKKEAKRRQRRQKRPLPEPYSSEDILAHDVQDLLGEEYIKEVVAMGEEAEWTPPAGLDRGTSITLRASAFTVSGESLSIYQPEGSDVKWAILCPFAHPGDLFKCVVYRHERLYSVARMEQILEYSEEFRGGEGDRRKYPDQGCKYFGSCGGCQLQPVPYELQLAHKKRTVELAYKRYSHLEDALIPSIRDTIPSPKQWGYRTKITPHFDEIPRKIKALVDSQGFAKSKKDHSEGYLMKILEEHNKDFEEEEEQRRKEREANVVEDGDEPEGDRSRNGEVERQNDSAASRHHDWALRIGFQETSYPRVLDIEECPIATGTLNAKLTEERQRVKDTILSFPRGATLLLRDTLPAPSKEAMEPFDPSTPVVPEDEHIAETNHKAPVYERVGDKLFTFTAGSFFQNNNSILPSLANYVKEAIFPPGNPEGTPRPTHLVDAYCGSGFFGISLAESFQKVAGVELDVQSIQAAKKNAIINSLEEKSTWLCGKAEEIFKDLPRAGFSGHHSCVIIDPPRKGCDEQFLRQLFDFRPMTIVYVSCNVHTQARDIGWFMHKSRGLGVEYNLESIRGFDLFPQTAHVESVAVLRLVK